MTRQFRLRGLPAAVAVCAAAATAPLLTGCGNADEPRVTAAAPSAPGTATATAPPRRTTRDQAERKALIQATEIPWDKAAGTAVAGVRDGRLTEIELRWARPTVASPGAGPRTPEWDTAVAAPDGTLHTVRVDAVSGQVTESRVDPGQDQDDKRELTARLAAATVTPRQAADTATGRTKGTVTALQPDDAVWSVDVVTTGDWNKTTYDVDARTGKVVRRHVDRD
ncbi:MULTISPECIES: PepSY domain-containing protein [Streptomyces]|uniref:PepSY domain-containing protein n=1 Tax=Streptomyces TaxID=1883 RepID=UPI0007CD5AFF|nr:hypothetical protein A4V12_06580 [Streptomyces noursei]